jgi:hypothetical protein
VCVVSIIQLIEKIAIFKNRIRTGHQADYKKEEIAIFKNRICIIFFNGGSKLILKRKTH